MAVGHGSVSVGFAGRGGVFGRSIGESGQGYNAPGAPARARRPVDSNVEQLHAYSHSRHLRHLHGRSRPARAGRRTSCYRLRRRRLSADEHAARSGRDRTGRGYGAEQVGLNPDCYVSATPSRAATRCSRRFSIAGCPTSPARWLADNVLNGRWVLAVAGTHGKTTTSSMLAWILEDAGLSPGFLMAVCR